MQDKVISKLLKRLHKVKREYNANFELMKEAVGTSLHDVYVGIERKLYYKEATLLRDVPVKWLTRTK